MTIIAQATYRTPQYRPDASSRAVLRLLLPVADPQPCSQARLRGVSGNRRGRTVPFPIKWRVGVLLVDVLDRLQLPCLPRRFAKDRDRQLAATDLKHARRAFELRYWSALAAVKYGSPNIRKGGSIVLTTGIAGRRPHKGWAVAASVCGTIEALTRALAIELAPIRVNAVSPGLVRTNLWQNMSAAERAYLYESVGNSLPIGRVGEVDDVAQAYLFLMQEEFSTGQTVVVDGGMVLV